MENTNSNSLLSLIEPKQRHPDTSYPLVSVVIPTFNCSQAIGLTLKSLLSQEYPNFEVIIVDGGSKDKTLEVINGFNDFRIRIFSFSGFDRYEMINKGIGQAKGVYYNFLFPGDFYTSQKTLFYMMTLALDNNNPHLLYCGTLLRDTKEEPKMLYRKMSKELLQRGQQPSSLESCWFHVDVFKELGKFDTSLKFRGGYDLLCRILERSDMRIVSTTRVLTDYDLRVVTKKMVAQHFSETFKIIKHYFGVAAVLNWLLIQKDFSRFCKLWIKSLKVAFVGRQS
jgi:glycosyltransferase involved in cell wall biosynthesis